MLISTDITIAFRDIYGDFGMSDITLFEIIKMNEIVDGVKVSMNKNREITLKLKCPLCGKQHDYKYSSLEVINRKLLIGGCEELGIPIFYMGRSYKVKERINRYKQINNEILAMI